MNIQNSLGVLLAILLFKKVVETVFFLEVWRGKNQQSSNLWIYKVKMALYLEIKNGIFLVWSVKSLGL